MADAPAIQIIAIQTATQLVIHYYSVLVSIFAIFSTDMALIVIKLNYLLLSHSNSFYKIESKVKLSGKVFPFIVKGLQFLDLEFFSYF